MKPDYLSNAPSLGDGIAWTSTHAPTFVEPVVKVLFRAWEPPQELAGDEEVALLARFCEGAEREYRAMFDTLGRIARDDDPSLNKDGRQKAAARLIEPRLGRLADQAANELQRVDAAIAQEQGAIAAASKPDAERAVLHDSIRRHWLAMEPGKRIPQGILYHQLDNDTLTALVSGPAYLSGIPEDRQQAMREELGRRLAPRNSARLKALSEGRAAAVSALSVIDTKARKFIDFDRARKLAEREAKRYD